MRFCEPFRRKSGFLRPELPLGNRRGFFGETRAALDIAFRLRRLPDLD
jgi:hypothetical protein